MKNVAKKPKELLIEAYEDLFKTGAFKGSELDKVVEKLEKTAVTDKKEETKVLSISKYTTGQSQPSVSGV